MKDNIADTGRDIVEREAFARILSRPQIVTAFFLPVDQARWIGDRYTLGPDANSLPRGQFAGVRLRPPDPTNIDAAPGRQVQGDLGELVRSVVELRKQSGLAGVVLSSEVIVARDNSSVFRARFGLCCPPDGSTLNEIAAAQECHRIIVSAIRKAGMEIEDGSSPDMTRGFDSVLDWTKAVRLKQGPPFILTLWPWLIVIGLMFVLWRGCDAVASLSN